MNREYYFPGLLSTKACDLGIDLGIGELIRLAEERLHRLGLTIDRTSPPDGAFWYKHDLDARVGDVHMFWGEGASYSQLTFRLIVRDPTTVPSREIDLRSVKRPLPLAVVAQVFADFGFKGRLVCPDTGGSVFGIIIEEGGGFEALLSFDLKGMGLTLGDEG